MWSITCPTVQNGGTATKSVCMRRPAVSSGYSRLRSSAARSTVGICARIACRSLCVQAFQHIGGIIRLQLGDRLGHGRLRQVAQQLVTNGLVQLRQRLRVEGGPQRFARVACALGVATARSGRRDRAPAGPPRATGCARRRRCGQRLGNDGSQLGTRLCGRPGRRWGLLACC